MLMVTSLYSGVSPTTLLHVHQSVFNVSVVTNVYTIQIKLYVTC